jgi:murein DD-endopeptidase MepM/ murein hydrolase activator NlpD
MRNGFSHRTKGIYDTQIGRFFYVAGIQSVRICKRIQRRVTGFFHPVLEWGGHLCSTFFRKRFRMFRRELRRIDHGVSIAKDRIQEARKRGKASYIAEYFKVTGKSVIRHKNLLLRIGNIAALVLAVAALVFTVHFWMNQDFGLVLDLGGEEIATVESEQTLEQAADMVNQRLVSDAVKAREAVGFSPSYRLSIVDKSHYTTPTSLCDKMIEKSGGSIEEATGLYVNGELVGAIKSSADLNYLLQNLLNEAKGEDKTAKASFVENVESVNGLYPVQRILSTDGIKEILQGTQQVGSYTIEEGDTFEGIAEKLQLSAEELGTFLNGVSIEQLTAGDQVLLTQENPLLTIKIVKEESYEAAVPFTTVTVNDDTQTTDYSAVTQEGADGKEQCVDQVTYIDGVETSRETVSRTILQEPVDKIIAVGTQKKVEPVEGVATGEMTWPVPYTHRVMSTYQMRWGKMHNGIDISSSGIRGQSIVAADGGTVTYVKYHNYGYGYHLMIDHGNGMSTLYAHCNSINVTPGQKVAKGQVIATVGTTGDSTGNHLHFEVYRNGSRIDPLSCVR